MCRSKFYPYRKLLWAFLCGGEWSGPLIAYAIHPQQLDGIKLILQEIASTKWHCALFSLVFPFVQFLLKCLQILSIPEAALGFVCVCVWGGGDEQGSRFFLQHTFNFPRTRVSNSERWLLHFFFILFPLQKKAWSLFITPPPHTHTHKTQSSFRYG
jgi:hypothetical protein